ncbi:hypothetical protein N7I40_004081 [Vibrio parahaemolyticus]|uniref:RepB family plasmid replication initiator protein n=1 Tax=Vibrio alginolyticus TaxID=663 RepID=UPI001BD4B339|nr:RepB family plasmid replication initiator protein [Vibrio alginolyticus]EGR3221710.1 hypothetical protein [Vibrio parahaemolyticus]EHK6545823.1 hypothetical protein [Vibrio parahaemolyticus]EJV5946454.1 hypothetical protein [Vibrio parahaemolyticus]EKN4564956.1 hypothetical protein [Vibrio parahaemolyticus]ELA7322566.1 hypothetical protein [Vibrio parahaemolyticus]
MTSRSLSENENVEEPKGELVVAEQSGQLVEVDFRRLNQYSYHSKKDAEKNIFRVGNEMMQQMAAVHPKSWRLLELAIKKLDLYSAKIPTHKDFIAGLESGEKYIPQEFRTIKIEAEEFADAYNITDKAAKAQFTQDALKLMDERLISISEDDEEGASIKIQQVVSGMTFRVRKGRSRNYIEYQPNDMFDKGESKIKLKHHCSEVEIELSMHTAKGLFLIMDRFTRINSNITRRLSPAAHKLYTLMCMERAAMSMKDSWEFSWSLDTWNSRLGTNHKLMSTLIRTFKAHEEITRETDIIAEAFPEESSKSGKSYKLFTVRFRTNTNFKIAAPKKKDSITRPRLPRQTRAAKVKGSSEQGLWARKCLKVLMRFRDECKREGKVFPKRDRERMEKCLSITGGLFDEY